jgi:hypothetical protein
MKRAYEYMTGKATSKNFILPVETILGANPDWMSQSDRVSESPLMASSSSCEIAFAKAAVRESLFRQRSRD